MFSAQSKFILEEGMEKSVVVAGLPSNKLKGGLHLTQVHPTGWVSVRRSVGMSMGLSAQPVLRDDRIAVLGIALCAG